jgi:hypothetical protein
MLSTAAWGAAPTGGAISITQDSNTAYTITIDTAPANIDTLYHCTLSGSDTTFVTILSDTTATSEIEVTGLSPLDSIIAFLLTRGEDGKTAISDKESFTMYGPEIEYYPSSRNDREAYDRDMQMVEQVIRGVSWRPDTLLDTFTIADDGRDSTAVYTPWKHNSLVAVATGDSVKVILRTWYGYRDMTQTGDTYGFAVSTAEADTLDLTAAGTFTKTLTENTAYPCMYWTLEGYTDNGHATEVQLWLSRERY